MKKLYSCTCILLLGVSIIQMTAQSPAGSVVDFKEADYSKIIDQRAAKIVSTLGLVEQSQSNDVHGIIVQQYRALGRIHAARDEQIAKAKVTVGADKGAAASAIQAAREKVQPAIEKLHREFLDKLSAELTAEQVDQVKDGLTYGVLPLTYGVYLKMYPELTDAQKRQIKDWLTEAREVAMDGSTSDEKHAVFGKYKGRINNYLSKAGYDAKQAEKNLKPSSPNPADDRSK